MALATVLPVPADGSCRRWVLGHPCAMLSLSLSVQVLCPWSTSLWLGPVPVAVLLIPRDWQGSPPPTHPSSGPALSLGGPFSGTPVACACPPLRSDLTEVTRVTHPHPEDHRLPSGHGFSGRQEGAAPWWLSEDQLGFGPRQAEDEAGIVPVPLWHRLGIGIGLLLRLKFYACLLGSKPLSTQWRLLLSRPY